MNSHGSNGLDKSPLLEINNGMDTGNDCAESYFGNSTSLSTSCGAIGASHQLDNSVSSLSNQPNSMKLCSSIVPNVSDDIDLIPGNIQSFRNKAQHLIQIALKLLY